MPSGTDEVKACMHAQIDLVGAAWLLLLQHIALVLVVEEFDDGLPAIAVVDVVAEPGSVDNGQAHLEKFLLQFGLGDLNFDRLVNLLGMAAAVIGVILNGCGEEGVDERRLAQPRLTSDHDGEGCAALGHDLVALVRQLQICQYRTVLPCSS